MCLHSQRAIAVVIGQTIVLNTFASEVPKAIPALSPRLVMNAGAAGLSEIAGSHSVEVILRAIWNQAIVRTMYVSLAFAVAAIPFEWLNAKEVAKDRKYESQADD
jgi:hypothetical protein